MKQVPRALALVLLAAQVAIPWTASHYVTQDGPSHIYTALVFRNLILHPHGLYSTVYRLQPRLVTEWATMLVLAVLAPLVGVSHAEQCYSSLLVILAFVSVTYFRRSFARTDALDPFTNFLANTWFVWIGYYNFYLGMAICLLLAGFYIRRAPSFSRRNAFLLAAGLAGLFFVHVMPAALAMMVIFSVAVWNHVALPLWKRHDQAAFAPWRPLANLAAVFSPTCVLLFFFVRHGIAQVHADSAVVETLSQFPMHVFASARGRAGEEALLVPAILFWLLAGLLGMKEKEWLSPRPALAISALMSFAGYLLLPDGAFGGGDIKIRLSWSIFIFLGVLASTTLAAQSTRVALSLYISICMFFSLVTAGEDISRFNRAAAKYAAALQKIPANATFVRLNYGMLATREAFGYHQMAMEPLLHTEAFVAASKHAIDLTDAWALNRLYPICLRKNVTGEQQNWLYQMEDGDTHGSAPLVHILQTLPLRVDYVVVVGDLGAESTGNSDLLKTEAWLQGTMREISSTDGGFVRVYERL